MSEVKTISSGALPPRIRARSSQDNVVHLAIAQALAGANSTVIYATGAILGNMLAPDKALATFPVSALVVGMAASTLPAGAIARRYGRRAAFLAGTGCGVLVGLLSRRPFFWGHFGCSAPQPFSRRLSSRGLVFPLRCRLCWSPGSR
jgi:MFS family permease